MDVNIKLFGDLREGRFEEKQSRIKSNSRVIDIINQYNLPLEQVSICMVNNRDAELEQVLQNGDTVAFSPPVGGM